MTGPLVLSENQVHSSLIRQRRQELMQVIGNLSLETLTWMPHTEGGQRITHSIYHLSHHAIDNEVEWRCQIEFRLGTMSREQLAAATPEPVLSLDGASHQVIYQRIEREARVTDYLVQHLTDTQMSYAWLNSRGEPRSVRWLLGHINAYYGQCIGQMIQIRRLAEALTP